MKIRIKGNSIRYRLTKSEVEKFCKTGYFEEQTPFGNQTLTYALRAKEGIVKLEADFKDDTITIFLPAREKEVWDHSDRVGYQNTVSLGQGKELFLLLEKDFVCLDETIEDQSDNYPNPNMP